MTISTTRIRNADGTWGWVTVVDEPEPIERPADAPAVRYEIVDRSDKAAMAAWRSGIHPSVIAHVDQVRAEQANDDSVELPCTCPDGRPCVCTAESVDPLD